MPNKKITNIPGLFKPNPNQRNNSRSPDNPFIRPEVLGVCAGVCSPPTPPGCPPTPVYALDDPLVNAIIDFSSECLENIAKVLEELESSSEVWEELESSSSSVSVVESSSSVLEELDQSEEL
ncbi:hypothetical protein Pcinc_022482 [Petrolisthes cinctipes]|uniref:Uncharacterized protein n=2 Tax=Petrolisthes cinctipes TaxID=88211 RepID=A0AAE1FDZ5_PETCI|nr:hypothetical protein Pcinc_023246 [Petrolisthes cinctipes]KAK3872433.1 hypothetical protein Pcinc_022482 [Petrolisthes cinctipes]